MGCFKSLYGFEARHTNEFRVHFNEFGVHFNRLFGFFLFYFYGLSGSFNGSFVNLNVFMVYLDGFLLICMVF